MPIFLIFSGLFLIAISLFWLRPAAAGEYKEAAPSSWSFSLGGGVAFAPEFEGSDTNEAAFLPLVEIEYKDRFFLSSMRGLGMYVVKRPEWNMGVAANYNLGREAGDSDLLDGMGDIDPSVDLGAFAEWTPGPFNAGLEIIQGTRDVKGQRVTAKLGYGLALGDDLHWRNSVSTTFASGRYNDTFFGVSNAQSRQSRLRYDEYKAGSGFKDVSFSTNLTWTVADNFSFVVLGGYSRLTGPAADSPLVRKGSKNQGTVGLGFVYAFGG